MKDIDTSKATGIDRLPGRFLKDGANVLAKSITDIGNLSISLNKLPSAFKLAKVKPIFKTRTRNNLCLYTDDSCLLFQHRNVTEKKPVNQRLQQYL